MGNVAVAGELAASDQLDELGRLDLSQTQPEDGDDGEEEGGGSGAQGDGGSGAQGDGGSGGQDGSGEQDDGTGIKPEGMPHE